MQIAEVFGNCNSRRYSRPWAAKITFEGTKPKYDFCGTFLGEYGRSFGHGTVVIDAEVGDIIAIGQKDGNGKYSTNTWYIIEEAGRREISRADALDIWRSRSCQSAQV